ncbi:hypothetical protein [Streptomyces canus]|uniref:hypothetical protein n=1 Tax=Streptomyces canus TaxID=58343 RepID=UPI00036FBD9E|nr:hypothetical protein [Streptomyces canus]
MKALALSGGLDSLTDVRATQVQVIVGDRPGFGPEEEPERPGNDHAHGGVPLFTPVGPDAVRAIEPSRRGELDIPYARRHLAGVPLRHRPVPVRGDRGEVRISS